MNTVHPADPKVYDILARAFLQEKVGAYFGLLGDANMYWATRMIEAGAPMTFVRHEHCAVAAAAAYARACGRMAVATMTNGPGVTQIMTALTIAVRARLPMVVFAGETPLGKLFNNQRIDQGPLITATGAAYQPMHSVGVMPEIVRNAFLQAVREQRPVVLGVPQDLQELAWTGTDALPLPSHELLPKTSPVPPHPVDVAKAAELVRGANRIVVMAGRGAVVAGAREACRTLAEVCGGFLAETLPVRGLFHEDPYSLGIAGGLSEPGSVEFFSEADLIIAVGCSLASHNADAGKLWPRAQLLQIDVNPVSVRDGRIAAQAHLRADAKLGAQALAGSLSARKNTWRTPAVADRLKAGRRLKDYRPLPQQDGHDPADVVAALDRHLPHDWHLVNTSGHVSFFTTSMLGRPHDRFTTIREFGAIGNGTSFAIGVARAFPDRTVVLLDGDGSFLMHLQELETISRHRLRILALVMNDGAFGSEIHKLRARGLSDAGAVFGRTDLLTVARGFGLRGEQLDDLSRVPELIEDFSKGVIGAVWNIPISDQVISARMHRATRTAH